MKKVKTVNSLGHILCHDLTKIVKGESKGVAFKKGHVIKEEDIDVLLKMGKEHLYIWENKEGMMHENEAAIILGEVCKNENIVTTDIREGKIELIADCDGLFRVNTKKLLDINSLDDIMIATRHTNYPVKKGDILAGTRVIPLVIEKEKMEKVKELGGDSPILELLPYKHMNVGIVTTGSEVYHGRIKDTFTPVIISKLEKYNLKLCGHKIVDDKKEQIIEAITTLKSNGADMIICTGGMSVDPDDVTPSAIKDCGAELITYGAPVLPGAMFLLAYFDDKTPVLGLPGCVMYADTTIFDLVLPRIVAGVKISKKDLAGLGHGGLCFKCKTCMYPRCEFGKGV